ncbi:hypothetical protein niasHS_011674 [Heterodera schachtii]|uniref:Uncharacterized protein n=1 Tax=Heterodera schachtii TaxID=97005 RepID=A0ABD2IUZ2_HETSC
MRKNFPISLITITVPSMITLLLITFGAISVVDAIEVVVEDGTKSEAEDMAKALALSKTHFWRHMMPGWECFSDRINSRDQFGFQSIGEMDHFCLKWKDMAWAVKWA